MESQTLSNGDRLDIYQDQIFDLPIEIRNLTHYKHITIPRKKIIREESCEVFLRRLRILSLDRHWRPGETLPQLAWLQDKQKLISCYEKDCEAQFKLYCEQPVEFLLREDNYFIHLMQDPWCFDQDLFYLCLADFVRAYNCFYSSDVAASQLQVQKLELAWKKSYHSKPVIEDLIQSGFFHFTY